MRNLNRVHRVLFSAAAILLWGCHQGMASSNQSQAAPILFDQFETVFYAKADLLSGSGGYKRLSQRDANALRAPFAYLLYALDQPGKQVSTEVLRNSDAALVGAKDFRAPGGPPPNLGAVQSSFCYILVLGNRSTFDISKVASKSGVMSSAENAVWKWSAPPDEGHSQPYTFYATQVAHSYLLISNSLDDVHAISPKLGSNTAPNLSGFRDWESISQHDLWGYRRYRHNEVNKVAAGTTEVTSTATSLSFFADPDKKTVVLRLFASDGSTAEKLNAHAGLPLPLLKSVGEGFWEATIPLSGDEASVERVFVAMGLFGFGVYL
jgi:hypothetical protein